MVLLALIYSKLNAQSPLLFSLLYTSLNVEQWEMRVKIEQHDKSWSHKYGQEKVVVVVDSLERCVRCVGIAIQWNIILASCKTSFLRLCWVECDSNSLSLRVAHRKLFRGEFFFCTQDDITWDKIKRDDDETSIQQLSIFDMIVQLLNIIHQTRLVAQVVVLSFSGWTQTLLQSRV